MQLRHSTFILLFILCCCFNRVDANDITFSHITTETGLSQYTVNTIYQDAQATGPGKYISWGQRE